MQQTAVVFYIGGNNITSARIASFNVISIHKNFFLLTAISYFVHHIHVRAAHIFRTVYPGLYEVFLD